MSYKMDDLIKALGRRGLLNWMPDRVYISLCFSLKYKRMLNLENPSTFNEKLQWLKLYDRRPEYVLFVDKYKVKQLVSKIIGPKYIIPTLGVWENTDEIPFKNLPDRFVLKCNHDSSSIIICKNKSSFDFEKAKKRLSKSLKRNGYYYGREWPYKNVHPLIIAEPYLEDGTLELRDYKFFCFNGIAKCFKIDFGRFTEHHANYYDMEMKQLPFGEMCYPYIMNKSIDIPNEISEMIILAQKLSQGYPFLRVDFYDVNGQIYFGELTLYPASGFGKFSSTEWDNTLGSWLSLPKKIGGK